MRLPILVAACALPFVLSACTLSPHRIAGPDPVPVRGESRATDRTYADAQYIARIDAQARRRGMVVEWVNPPSERARAPNRR